MRRTAPVLALAALLAPAPALAQESPQPTATPSNCNSGGSVSVSRPSSQRIVAGEAVTFTISGTGAVDDAYATFSGYRWETPTRRGEVQFETPTPNEVVRQVAPLARGESASATVVLRPTTSTRVSTRYGFRAGCLYADGGSARPDEVIDVAPRLTLTAVRNGVRDYTFSGVATTPGLVVNLYRVDVDGSRVLTSQTRATGDRTWTVRRTFLGSGRFGFVAVTGRTMANAPGESGTRPTVVH